MTARRLFVIEEKEDETIVRLGNVVAIVTTKTKLITPNTVIRADVVAWVTANATGPEEGDPSDGDYWSIDVEPIGYLFHNTLETLIRDVIEALGYLQIEVTQGEPNLFDDEETPR